VTAGPAARYRLRGQVGGVVRAYALPAGSAGIGSVAGNEVVLPVRGVSRQHARVVVAEEDVTLEDLGSRNGTLANGVRIQRTRLQPGDEVRFGPVVLRLETIEGDDAELADIAGGPLPTLLAGLSGRDTTAVSSDDTALAALDVVEGFLSRLAVRPHPDLAGAVALLRRELGARGAGVFEMARLEPVVVAADGDLPELAGRDDLRDFARDAPAGAVGAISAHTFPGDAPLTCAIAGGPGGERLGLAVWGAIRIRPGEAERLLRVLLLLAARLRARPLHEGAGAAPQAAPGLVFPEGYVRGGSPAMASVYAQMQSLAQGHMPVLLLGETGVGKEHLARMLHASSPRRSRPFVAVNCAAIPSELLEAEMFGIGKGVATGVAERPGKFQAAAGGTLFLDEIGDMPLALQAKLLRALQEKEVQPVGGAAVPVDIRVVSATNSDLQRRLEEGHFRRDLYYRVAGIAILVPPLRERREDVPALVEDFLRVYSREAGRSPRGITVKALRLLIEHAWPGNVRELQHEVRRLVYLCPAGEAIESSMLSEHILAGPRGAQGAATASLELEPNVDQLERRMIREALARVGGNRSQAARLLGVSRNGLANKMERLGITD
jgi:DNA-binding NtrC family response regulator